MRIPGDVNAQMLVAENTVVATAAYAMTPNDRTVIADMTVGTGYTVTLPPVQECAGKIYTVRTRNAKPTQRLTVAQYGGSESFPGLRVLSYAGVFLFYSDGMSWFDVGKGDLYHETLMTYVDVTVTGLAVGAHNTGLTIPDNTIIWRGFLDVITQPDSAENDATIALHVNTANDIVNATIETNGQWASAGIKAIIPVGTAGTAVKTTAARELIYTVAVHDLTVGLFYIVLDVIRMPS